MHAKEFESKSIIVNNIPFKMSSNDVIREFSSVGKITKIIFSKKSQSPNFNGGFCKITYNSTAEAEAAISKFDGRCFLGHSIFVKKCHEKNPSENKFRRRQRYPIQKKMCLLMV